MNRDIIRKTIRQYLNESQGRSGFLYEQFSKLVEMLRRDFANSEFKVGIMFHIYDKKELISLLEPYAPTSKINSQLKGKHDFFIKKFDGNGNIIEIIHRYDYEKYGLDTVKRIIKLTKPLDLFGYFLNKRTDEYYFKLFSFAFIREETFDFAQNIIGLIDSTKNTGDKLSRDSLSLRDDLDPNKPYKYCWDEVY